MMGQLGGTERKAQATLASLTIMIAIGCAAVGCAGSDDSDPRDPKGGMDSGRDSGSEEHHPADAESEAKAADGASAVFSKPSNFVLTFPGVACGGASETDALTVKNQGSSTLAVSATTVGSGFSVSPSVLEVRPGKTGTLTVAATAPNSATAGASFAGALNLDTNDPTQRNLTYQLSATPNGATLQIQPVASFDFPATLVGSPYLPPLVRTLTNTGNASATFTFAAPANPLFSMSLGGADGGPLAITLNAGQVWEATAEFLPTSTSVSSATSSIIATGAVCGSSQASVTFSGQGAIGDVGGWPSTVDFGPSTCGGVAPADQTFTLTNTGPVDAHITSVSLTGAPGFTTNAEVGRALFAGGAWTSTLSAPPVPTNAPASPVTATLTIETDADTSPHVITLTEEPSGALLAFDTSPTPNFGSFGPVQLLGEATQYFNVVNTGSAPATVTLVASAGGATGASSPFSVSPSAFTIGPNGVQADSARFTPLTVSGVTGSIGMVALTGSICGSLPAPISLSGSGIGGGPVVTQSSLTFLATCGGAAPPTQSFLVQNNGTADLTWSMSGPAGAGASQYAVTASPPPGVLIPGAVSVVNVTARAVPSPVANPAIAAFAAQLTITTDVPFDPPHVVSLGETPVGDQLSFSTPGPLRFGQVPIGTMLSQPFTLANSANPGSPAATVFFAIGGPSNGGYVTPAPALGLGPGAAASENLSFFPTSDIAYPATLAAVTTDALCTPLPTPLPLTGTGTQGVVAVSASTLTFGTSPSDPQGLVNCGSSGLAHTVTVSSVGNQPFQIIGATLGKGASSAYTLSGAAAALPVAVPIGGSVTLVVTPSPIPQSVLNPNDPTPFLDTLTITTNAALDSPHQVALVMQARGAVIANTPLATTWPFGTVSFGSIGTLTSSIQNTGNASVSIALKGLTEPSIFGLQSNPTVGNSGVTSIIGQFTPPASDGQWADTGTLVVTASQAFCQPLPSAWNNPTITLSGTSNSNPAVTVSGTLIFPSTDCGSAAPAGQAVLLSNATNVAYAYRTSFNSGKYYDVSNPAFGTVAANGTATIIVTPATVTPGPGVTPGSAPYADELVITVATAPPTQLTVPISWALNGAVLSLPFGAGSRVDSSGSLYYPADSTSGYPLPMLNTGNASAGVDFSIVPFGSFAFSPAPPIQVTPGVGAMPALVSSSADRACPGVTMGTATFFYSGPVCQPFPLSQVTIEACFGTF